MDGLSHPFHSVAENKKRGRKAHITLEVVQRVADRVGLGIPLNLALLSENNPFINEGSWKMAIKRNPKFVTPYHAAKATFLEKAVRRLAEADDLRWLTWLLERRHSDLFARQPDTSINVQQSIIGLPDDVLARARDYAKNRK